MNILGPTLVQNNEAYTRCFKCKNLLNIVSLIELDKEEGECPNCKHPWVLVEKFNKPEEEKEIVEEFIFNNPTEEVVFPDNNDIVKFLKEISETLKKMEAHMKYFMEMKNIDNFKKSIK